MPTADKSDPDDADGSPPSAPETTANPSTADAAVASADAAVASADDDMKRRYLEALERKRAGGSAAATGHGSGGSAAPTSNDKVKRTFRRRAGG